MGSIELREGDAAVSVQNQSTPEGVPEGIRRQEGSSLRSNPYSEAQQRQGKKHIG